MESVTSAIHREPWNKGKIVGQKSPFKVKDIWALRVRLQMEHRIRELALFNLGIDSKLRGCDLVALKVRDVCHGDQMATRAIVMQHKTQRPVQFEITSTTRDALQAWIKHAELKSDSYHPAYGGLLISIVNHIEILMSHFWAKFQSSGGELFRLDTRIYLKNIDAPRQSDSCIGAIVGKNPGSAKPSAFTGELQPIQLDGDKLLPTVRNIITKAYVTAEIAVPDRGYVQVLNLFYLCNPILSQAVSSISQISTPPICKSEVGRFPWVWYVWGDDSVGLRPHKERFSKIDSDHSFFFDNRIKEVKGSSPQHNEFAKHTQGLKHIYVVPYIAQIIENS